MADDGSMRVASVAEDALNTVGVQMKAVSTGDVNSESVLRAYAMVVIFCVTEELEYDGKCGSRIQLRSFNAVSLTQISQL